MIVSHVLSSLQIGGGERVALELAAGQIAAGDTVSIVSLAPLPEGPLGAPFRQRGASVHTVAKGRGVDPTLPLRLGALFLRLRPQIVHTHNRMPLMYGAPAGKLCGAATVHTRHGPGKGTARERWLWRIAARFLDAYVAVSPTLGDLARSLNDCAPDKLSVIENGIDVGRFAGAAGDRGAVRAALGIPADAWVVGSVGRLATEKAFPFLIRAAAPLLGPAGHLVIVGDGAERGAIRAQAEASGVSPFVHLTGARDDVPSLLAAMDVFALSSAMEGLPLCVLEAMAAGLPVVATAVGGLPALIQDGGNGFLVPSGDEPALRARLQALRGDPALARAVAERGQAYVRQHHSGEAMVRRYTELYASARGRA